MLSVLQNIKLRLLFKLKKVKYADFPILNGIVVFKIGGTLSLGREVKVNSGYAFNPVGNRNQSGFYILKGASLSIGNNVGISNSLIHCKESITLEDNVMIGGGCHILDNDFHPLNYEKRIKGGNSEAKSKPIVIRNGAFIGLNCILLKGTQIGEKSIVAGGSVVSGVIPKGEIWGGNPAKFIKKIE
jgi:acetyltransferase-like isoleucine patch superfamily enzyme